MRACENYYTSVKRKKKYKKTQKNTCHGLQSIVYCLQYKSTKAQAHNATHNASAKRRQHGVANVATNASKQAQTKATQKQQSARKFAKFFKTVFFSTNAKRSATMLAMHVTPHENAKQIIQSGALKPAATFDNSNCTNGFSASNERKAFDSNYVFFAISNNIYCKGDNSQTTFTISANTLINKYNASVRFENSEVMQQVMQKCKINCCVNKGATGAKAKKLLQYVVNNMDQYYINTVELLVPQAISTSSLKHNSSYEQVKLNISASNIAKIKKHGASVTISCDLTAHMIMCFTGIDCYDCKAIKGAKAIKALQWLQSNVDILAHNKKQLAKIKAAIKISK